MAHSRTDLTAQVIDSLIEAHPPVARPVAEINPETREVVQIFRSIKNASDQTGIDRHSISNCCNGRYKQVRGRKFVWVRSTAPEGV